MSGRSMGRRLGVAATALLTAASGCGEGGLDASAVLEAYDGAAARVTWPGFEPAAVPLAVWDGDRTYLFRHPEPPEGFRALRRPAGTHVLEGRLAGLTANTSMPVGEHHTATALAESPEARAPERLAPLLLHEAFHVHQSLHHPEWAADEVELFTYPVRDPGQLRLRRLETAALRRAVEAPDSVRRVCWAHAALGYRARRHRGLPVGAVGYERGIELWEGLARFVERMAAGTAAGAPRLPAEGFPPEDVRERGYAVGSVLAWLLDGTGRAWRAELAAAEEPSLHGLLEARLPPRPRRSCAFPADEEARALAVARADLRELERRDAAALEAFEGRPGWRLVVEAPTESPLFPAGFDPSRLRLLADGTVLHERWLRLEGAAGHVEVLDRPSLTRPAGDHPLFAGVRRLTVTGLEEPPALEAGGRGGGAGEEDEATLALSLPGLTLRLVGTVERPDGRTVRVRLSSPSASG